MANFLQIDLDGYGNPFVLKHLGTAISAIAADLEKEHSGGRDKDACTCAAPAPPVTEDDIIQAVEKARQEVPAPPVEASVLPDGTLSVVYGAPAPVMPPVPAPPTPPEGVELTPIMVPPAPPAPLIDDADWPDPPQPEQAANDHLDADGIPWDVRIHAGTKTRLKADNTWKLKPGVDKALVEQVKAELKGVQAVPVPQAGLSAVPHNAALAEAIRPHLPAAPPAPAGPTSFAELIKEVTGRITAGQMTPDQVNGAVSLVTNGQLTMCNQLAARQDLIPAVWSVLCPTVS